MKKKMLLGSAALLAAFVGGTVSADEVDSNVSMNIDSQTFPVGDIHTYDTFEIKGTFSRPDGVKGGDTTTMTLPDALRFYSDDSTETPLYNKNNEELAKFAVDADKKTMTIKYDDKINGLIDVKGDFSVNLRVDTRNVTTTQAIPVTIDVNGKPVHAGDLNYTGVGEVQPNSFFKSGWSSFTKDNQLEYGIYFNQQGENRGGTYTLKDSIAAEDQPNVSLDVDSLKVYVGTWAFDKIKGYYLTDMRTIDQSTYKVTDDSFEVTFDLADGQGFQADYKYKWVAGADVTDHDVANTAEVSRNDVEKEEKTISTRILKVSGNIEGRKPVVPTTPPEKPTTPPTPEKPTTPPTPEKPQTPPTPKEEPKKPGRGGQEDPGKGQSKKEVEKPSYVESGARTLPQTGETSSLLYMATAAGFMAGAAALVYGRKED